MTIACPGGLVDSIKANTPDIMTLPLGKGEEWTPDMAEKLMEKAQRADALVIGPGLGRSSGATRFIKTCVPHCTGRTVLDAERPVRPVPIPGTYRRAFALHHRHAPSGRDGPACSAFPAPKSRRTGSAPRRGS